MLSKLRARLTYANVMATIAVFIALGGSSYAALTVTGKNVKNGSLTGKDIKNSSLTTSDVKNRSLLSKDFKSGQLPAGARGPKGDTGPLTGPAGGDLTGTYPNPELKALAMTDVNSSTLGNPDGFVWCYSPCATRHWNRDFEDPGFPRTAYGRDASGVVHLRGWPEFVSDALCACNTIFRLPPGYRPASTERFTSDDANQALDEVEVTPAGQVNDFHQHSNVSNGRNIKLNGITFRCAPSGSDGCP